MHEMADWLHSIGMTVMVEPAVKREDGMSALPFLETWKGQEELKNLHKRVDFIICLGGGQLSHAQIIIIIIMLYTVSFSHIPTHMHVIQMVHYFGYPTYFAQQVCTSRCILTLV